MREKLPYNPEIADLMRRQVIERGNKFGQLRSPKKMNLNDIYDEYEIEQL